MITSTTSVLDVAVCVFVKKLLLYRSITSNINGFRMQKLHRNMTHSIAGAGREPSLFLSNISAR